MKKPYMHDIGDAPFIKLDPWPLNQKRKLTDIQVYKIKHTLKYKPLVTLESLAKKYKVSYSCIQSISSGRTWRQIHVD